VIEYPRQPGSVIMPAQRYEQVAEDLRHKIETGVYPPGTRLPSRRELMEEYHCSDTVIGKAMMLLRAAGLTETQSGVAVYVAERPTTND
jgi:GntR family transcriptional regulator